MSNVGIDKLTPGVFGVSHGSGVGGMIIRDATGSWAGHAFLYLGDGMVVQGTSPKADLVPATTYGDAIWAWRMWDQLMANDGWTGKQVATAMEAVTNRGHALVGTTYDWPAYIGFTAEVLHLRNEQQLDPVFQHDTYRVCSALVDDAETFGGVPLDFVPEDGPGLTRDAGNKQAGAAMITASLVAPGMLLGLAQRKEWA